MADPTNAAPNTSASLNELKRLGRNISGYSGETIPIATILGKCLAAAEAFGWAIHRLGQSGDLDLLAFTRNGCHVPGAEGQRCARQKVYISTGIHGDEPAGPLSILRLLEEDAWPDNIDLWLCPCLNPAGFLHNRREGPSGVDLNRQYRDPVAAETQAHIRWLEAQPSLDLTICVHEDWESEGFYVYELNPEGRESLAGNIVAAVARVCPIDRSALIEGRPAQNGIIRPNLDPRSRPDWPEAFYLITRKSRLSYTLEAPSDFALDVRVAALIEGVRAAVDALLESPTPPS